MWCNLGSAGTQKVSLWGCEKILLPFLRPWNRLVRQGLAPCVLSSAWKGAKIWACLYLASRGEIAKETLPAGFFPHETANAPEELRVLGDVGVHGRMHCLAGSRRFSRRDCSDPGREGFYTISPTSCPCQLPSTSCPQLPSVNPSQRKCRDEGQVPIDERLSAPKKVRGWSIISQRCSCSYCLNL